MEPADVHVPQIHARRAVHDPVGDRPPRAAGRLNADGIESRRHEQPRQFRRRPKYVAHVRSETFRSVEQHAYPGSLQQRDAPHRRLQQRLEMVEILCQLIEAEIFRNAVGAPGSCARLETSDQQLACVFLDVDAMVRIAQHRQIFWKAGDRFGYGVKMLGRVQRNHHAFGGAKIAAPNAARQYHGFCAHVPLCGHHACCAGAVAQQARDLHALEDARPVRPRGRGESLRGVDRIGLPVGRQKHSANHIIDIQDRISLQNFLRHQRLDRQPEQRRHAGLPLQFRKALGRRRETDRAGTPIPGLPPRLVLQPLVQLCRVPARAVSG